LKTTFKLTQKFLDEYKNKRVLWGYGDLGFTTYKRTYARKKSDGSLENWWETVQRVVEGTFSIQKKHCENFNLEWNAHKAQKSAQIMYDKIFNFKFSPPGRGLWAMGSAIIDKVGSAPLNNCAFVSTENINVDFSEPFTFVMDMSMLGVGCGFDTRGAGKIFIKKPKSNGNMMVISDSRDGWVDCLRVVLESYQGAHEYKFDFSKIRPAGAPIKTFGGIAPGPEPLKEMVYNIQKLLDKKIGEAIDSVTIVDLMNVIGKCVVSGNIRRTALVAIGDDKDKEYVTMKDPELHDKELQSHRWTSNNSVFATVGQDYSFISNSLAKNGEPGIVWLDNIRSFGRKKDGYDKKDYRVAGLNPCLEQPLESNECCNLVETYPANHVDAEEFLDTLKYAYMYAKTVTLVPTHLPKTNAVVGRNRRIGTSMSGVDQAINKFGRRRFFNDFCNFGYNAIKTWDEIYSEWLCVPKSIRISTIKPSGTVSLLAAAFPGIHKTHGKKYLRTVRYASNSPYIKAFETANYLVEDDYYDKYSKVVYFPIEEKHFKKSKFETSMREQFQLVADMQYWWSDNAISCTITFKDTEVEEIQELLETYEDRLKVVSLLPLKENGYVQSPYITVSNEVAEEKRMHKNHKVVWTNEEFKEYMAKIDSKILQREINKIDNEGIGEKFCSTDTCEIKSHEIRAA
jgi:ribonucleoside-triphosphate reductase (thioredoxin)